MATYVKTKGNTESDEAVASIFPLHGSYRAEQLFPVLSILGAEECTKEKQVWIVESRGGLAAVEHRAFEVRGGHKALL